MTKHNDNLFGFPIYRLESLHERLSKMQCVQDKRMYKRRQNHSRAVYFDEPNQLYYKVWPKRYILRDAVANAFSVGFYDKDFLTVFVAFIVDSAGFNRGYVTRAGQSIPSDENTDELIDELVERALRTNYFFFDAMPHNIVRIGDRLCVIDLESIAPISDLHCLPSTINRNIAPLSYRTRLFDAFPKTPLIASK